MGMSREHVNCIYGCTLFVCVMVYNVNHTIGPTRDKSHCTSIYKIYQYSEKKELLIRPHDLHSDIRGPRPKTNHTLEASSKGLAFKLA